MGIGKRGIGILCGLVLCVLLMLVLCLGQPEKQSRENMEQESAEIAEVHASIPAVTDIPKTQTSKRPIFTEVPADSENPGEENVTPLPIVSAPPILTENPTRSPIPKVTKTPQPAVVYTPAPIAEETKAPIIEETTTPIIVQPTAPTAVSTPSPEVPEKEEEEHVHEFEMYIWELPTCLKGGYYNNICKECGLVESVTQEPIGHEVEDIVIQEGNCMEDQIIRHICKMCEQPVKSDTRYTVNDKHLWMMEQVDGADVECCVRCGVTK